MSGSVTHKFKKRTEENNVYMSVTLISLPIIYYNTLLIRQNFSFCSFKYSRHNYIVDEKEKLVLFPTVLVMKISAEHNRLSFHFHLESRTFIITILWKFDIHFMDIFFSKYTNKQFSQKVNTSIIYTIKIGENVYEIHVHVATFEPFHVAQQDLQCRLL